jgi:predicted nucleic acid-binding protein
MRYWDSSALVPLLVRERDTTKRQAQLSEDAEIVTWWATRVECASALNRLARSGDLTEENLRKALRKLDGLAATWIEVLPSDRVKAGALRLLRLHGLRAADSLQLSACLQTSEGDPARMILISADKRLREAGDREGLCVEA